MKLKIIKSKKEYESYLDWVDQMFDKKVKPNTEEGESLQIMLLLIKQYEDRYFPVPKPDPMEVVKLKMKERGIIIVEHSMEYITIIFLNYNRIHSEFLQFHH